MTTPVIQHHILPTPEAAGAALAQYVATVSEQAIRERDRFIIALSGGSMPRLLFPPLVNSPLREKIDWSAWHIFWADERFVPLAHADSNFRLTREYLLSQVRIPVDQVYPLDDSFDLEITARLYQSILEQVLQPPAGQPPQFDLILLGMGEDGHTASLFPQHPLLHEKSRWVAYLTDSPKPPPERITLTLPVINYAQQVAFLVTGPGKADALATVLGGAPRKDSLPAALVQPVNGQVHWFVDQAAAQKLNA